MHRLTQRHICSWQTTVALSSTLGAVVTVRDISLDSNSAQILLFHHQDPCDWEKGTQWCPHLHRGPTVPLKTWIGSSLISILPPSFVDLYPEVFFTIPLTNLFANNQKQCSAAVWLCTMRSWCMIALLFCYTQLSSRVLTLKHTAALNRFNWPTCLQRNGD